MLTRMLIDKNKTCHIFWGAHLWHSDLTCLFDTLVGHPCLTLLWDTLAWHSCGTLLLDTLVGHSYLTLLLDTLVGHSCLKLLWETLTWHFCRTLLLHTLVGHSCLKLLWDTLTWHSCKTLLLDTLVGHSYLTLLYTSGAFAHKRTLRRPHNGLRTVADSCERCEAKHNIQRTQPYPHTLKWSWNPCYALGKMRLQNGKSKRSKVDIPKKHFRSSISLWRDGGTLGCLFPIQEPEKKGGHSTSESPSWSAWFLHPATVGVFVVFFKLNRDENQGVFGCWAQLAPPQG